MFGEIGAWFYKGLGGIFPDPAQPGFQNILLRPHFIKGLKRFEARHRSPYGEIVSRWEWKGKCVHYEVTVPANSTATLTFTPTRPRMYGWWNWRQEDMSLL
ncbi:hypothetical protein NIB75_04490 [Bacteroides uniformis]|nr:hypothetical protein [Bacteroides uniformis]